MIMNQRLALLLATGLSTFLLVTGGAVAGRVSGTQAAPTPTAVPTEDIVALLQQREAEYQRLLAQANAQLEQVYSEQAAQPTATAEPEYPVSPDQAAMIAMGKVPGAILMSTPELVNFQGTVAYEVVLNRGKVYVDAATGAVLYNGAAAPAVVVQSGGGGGGGGHEHEDDHEGEHEGGDD
jgi:uncharacterized membrane protein YkoI